MATSSANRGKYAEGKFKDYCNARSEAEAAFAWYRFPDAHAGSLAAVPADFEVLYSGRHLLVEVKEVGHVRLLPHKNFSADKVARCRKFQLAGSTCWVLVLFTPLNVTGRGWRDAKAWRLAPIDWFLTKTGGSWDLSGYPLMTFSESLTLAFQPS